MTEDVFSLLELFEMGLFEVGVLAKNNAHLCESVGSAEGIALNNDLISQKIRQLQQYVVDLDALLLQQSGGQSFVMSK